MLVAELCFEHCYLDVFILLLGVRAYCGVIANTTSGWQDATFRAEIRASLGTGAPVRYRETPVRFQTTETVQTPDFEIVLRTLETTLPEISSEVVRDGQRITLRGLGPSPRTRNPRDITILHVSSDDATTVIHADVTFQASALLGATSQDSVVRSKLDYVFDQVRSQLSLETRRSSMSELVPHAGVFAPKIDFPVAETDLCPPTEFVGEEFAGQGPSAGQEPSARLKTVDQEPVERPASPVVPGDALFTQSEPADVEPVAETVREAITAATESPSPAPAESAPVVFDPPAAAEVVKPLSVFVRFSPALEPPVETAIAPIAEPAKPRAEHSMLRFSSSQPRQRTHVPALITAIVALLLLFAVAAYYLLRPNPPDPTPTSLPAETQPVNQSSEPPIFCAGGGSRQAVLLRVPVRFLRSV